MRTFHTFPFKFKGDLPHSIASTFAAVALVASGLALSACSNQPNAKKVFINAVEEYEQQTQSKDAPDPFDGINYVEMLEPKEANEIKERYYDYNDGYIHKQGYYLGDDGVVYSETPRWPTDKIILLIKTMDQLECSEEKRFSDTKYKCMVTTDSLNAVAGGSRYYFKKRYNRDINGLNGFVYIIKDNQTKELKFVGFKLDSYL